MARRGRRIVSTSTRNWASPCAKAGTGTRTSASRNAHANATPEDANAGP
jgi:hypothetical protein